MNTLQLALLLTALAAALITAILVGRRGGDSPRVLRWMLGAGAGLGGAALVVLSVGGDA